MLVERIQTLKLTTYRDGVLEPPLEIKIKKGTIFLEINLANHKFLRIQVDYKK